MTVAAITWCFVFLVGALVWLSSTVDRSLHDRADAAAVAFQAARSGAQAVDVTLARSGVILLDPVLARQRAAATVASLLTANADTGSMAAVSVEGRRVTVTVTITTTGRPATATASAVARPGVSGAEG